MLTRLARARRLGVSVVCAGLLAAQLLPAAHAQVPPAGTPSQFDFTGFLQSATVDSFGDPHSGGTLVVNGHKVIVPRETIVILPANALTWEELFDQAPADYRASHLSGMALADTPVPLTTYEVHVVGNRVGDQLIAGLINISQQGLNSGSGYVNFIDYVTGEIRVGGKLVMAGGVVQNVLDPNNPGARVRINDPGGKFGRSSAAAADPRFTLDPDNPTIRTETAFPICLPRVTADPSIPGNPDDPLCPLGNRPRGIDGNFAATFQYPNPATLAPGQLPDPRIMAPIEIGDFVSFNGTLVTDSGSTGPYPGTPSTYISAHTITSNIALFTAPGTNPAYVAIDVTLIGTGGLTVLGAGEATLRTRFEGMSTDPTRNINLYAVDLDPISGATSDRLLGSVGVDPGAAAGGAVAGRWRFRPPCTAAVPSQKGCTPSPTGTYLPPPREVRAVIAGLEGQVTNPQPIANGIIYGQYHAPIGEYIFPENIPGVAPPPNNFDTIPFLAQGGYASTAGTLVGQLNPWPGATVPASACPAPTVTVPGNFAVASGAANVSLSGSASGTGTTTYQWTQVGGPGVTLNNATSATATFNAPAGPATLNFTLTATNTCSSGGSTLSASASGNVSVAVSAPAAPVLNAIAAKTVLSGAPVTLTASGDQSPLTFTWTQTGGPVAVIASPSTGASISFTRNLPVGQLTGETFTFSVVGTNGANVTSAPITTSVTVNPVPDVDTITATEYRTSKQRLVLSASSSVISPNVVLTLQPYLTINGNIFDPTSLGATFTNNGGGLHTLTLVGAPEPALPPVAPLVVKSNLGGVSAPAQLTNVRR